jgi:hypothetical protein
VKACFQDVAASVCSLLTVLQEITFEREKDDGHVSDQSQ